MTRAILNEVFWESFNTTAKYSKSRNYIFKKESIGFVDASLFSDMEYVVERKLCRITKFWEIFFEVQDVNWESYVEIMS